MNSLAFGCSHTFGLGVKKIHAWPHLVGALNLGVTGVSSDFIARTISIELIKYKPNVVYILWPDWTRFEYYEDNKFKQSLLTDSNRIYFMETATEDWLQNNFIKQIDIVKDLCKDTKLIDMTLYDLITFIDHADTWPISRLGHHYNEQWHQWVADIFKNEAEWIKNHRLFA